MSILQAIVALSTQIFANPYVQSTLISIWASLTKFFYELEKGRKFILSEFFTEIFGAAFFGFMAVKVSSYLHGPSDLAGLISGVAGLGGAKTMEIILILSQKIARKYFGLSDDPVDPPAPGFYRKEKDEIELLSELEEVHGKEMINRLIHEALERQKEMDQQLGAAPAKLAAPGNPEAPEGLEGK